MIEYYFIKTASCLNQRLASYKTCGRACRQQSIGIFWAIGIFLDFGMIHRIGRKRGTGFRKTSDTKTKMRASRWYRISAQAYKAAVRHQKHHGRDPWKYLIPAPF
jgi:hypothetical protein